MKILARSMIGPLDPPKFEMVAGKYPNHTVIKWYLFKMGNRARFGAWR